MISKVVKIYEQGSLDVLKIEEEQLKEMIKYVLMI